MFSSAFRSIATAAIPAAALMAVLGAAPNAAQAAPGGGKPNAGQAPGQLDSKRCQPGMFCIFADDLTTAYGSC